MLVKKFEADTIDEALRAVKADLGPDAIILKTVTNKGLKGAFKKKRIEITAAISEKSLDKKAKVDRVLTDDQRKEFYARGASSVKSSIDGYAQGAAPTGTSYGQLGLNKMVNQITRSGQGIADAAKSTRDALKQGLDDFLSDDLADAMEDDAVLPPPRPVGRRQAEAVTPASPSPRSPASPSGADAAPAPVAPALSREARELISELRQELRTQSHRLELLEEKLRELSPTTPLNTGLETRGIQQLRTTLKTLEVDEAIVLDLVRKATYELSRDDLANPDVVFEFALRELTQAVCVAHPLFSTLPDSSPVVTVLLSEAAAGQSSMALKLAVLKTNVEIVQFSAEGSAAGTVDFAAQVFGLKVRRAQSTAEVIQLSRTAVESGRSVIVDLRLANRLQDDTKKFIEALRRGFEHVEVLITLSAIHGELYNRKILSRYKELGDGLIISHVDLCLNFGALYNVHRSHPKLPLKFFGTGPVVPDDVESATAERIMAGLFQFD